MSAADEVLKLRQDLIAAKTERDNAKAEAINLRNECFRQSSNIRELKLAVDYLTGDKAKLLAKLTWWRVMAIAEGLMLLGVWANTYLFGGAS